MASSATVTLFTEQFEPSRRPVTLVLSALIHAGVIALVSFGILYAPRLDPHVREGLIVRQLDLHPPLPSMPRAAKGVAYPGPLPSHAAQKPSLHPPSPGKSAPHPASLVETAHARIGKQTLLQPDLTARLALREEVPVPQVLIWTPRVAVVKKIVPPKPEPPTSALAKPSVDAPNQEINLSDVEIASSRIAQQKIQIMPSTTSPVVVHGPDLIQLPPSTVSQIAAQPTPAAVMSLSNLRLEGTANLPPVNESAPAASQGVMSPLATNNGAREGTGQGTGQGTAQGDGSGAGNGAGQGNGSNGPQAKGTPGRPNGRGSAPGQNYGEGQDAQDTSTEITLPKTGQFGAVVLGDSLQYEYPELSGVWNGRMAYTVYLHVGLARSWILQYSLPTTAAIKLNGASDRLEAPWPYNIVRPNLAPNSIDADALMVHGFVNASGRFEALSIVFPESFSQAQFVLRSLERWQFRPATQNGQIARVEVLLIIPEELE